MFIPHRYYLLVACVLLTLVVGLGDWAQVKILKLPKAIRVHKVIRSVPMHTRQRQPVVRLQVGTEEWRMNLRKWFLGLSEQARAPNY